MTVRTILRYAGGKARALKHLAKYMPLDCDEHREPFVGGGSVALYASVRYPNATIWVNDAFRPVTSFYQVVQSQSDVVRMIDELLALHARTKTELKALTEFNKARATMDDTDATPLQAAVAFYYFNRCSFSGASSSGFVKDNWVRWRNSEARIKDLASWTPLMANWRITNLDYSLVIAAPWTVRKAFLFLDPPYALPHRGNLYVDHSEFCQDRFQQIAEAVDVPCLITLNAELQRNFEGWPINKRWRLEYSMRSTADYRKEQKNRHELLLANYTLGGRILDQRASARRATAATSAGDFRALLERLGLSQVKAAEHLGVTDRAVRFWVSGERKVPAPVIMLLRNMEDAKKAGKRRI